MNIKVLGSSGAELPGCKASAFLIDGKLLFDAGTIGSSLGTAEQWKIRNIILTHSHLDHIKAIPFLADNIVITRRRHSVNIFGIRETLNALRSHVLNNTLWPDFTRISASIDPVLKLHNISRSKSFKVCGYTISACSVSHTVPAVGYIIRDKTGRSVLYTGDTGPTDKIWKIASGIHAAIIEVSFPNEKEALAIKTGHLTAGLLLNEISKMKNRPERILITHPKAQFIRQISREVSETSKRTGIPIEIVREGRVYKV